MKNFLMSALLTALLCGSTSQLAAAIIYDNGPWDGTSTSYSISNTFMTDNTFVVSIGTIGARIEIEILVAPGKVPLSTGWGIFDSSYARVASGESLFTNQPPTHVALGRFSENFDLYRSSFDIYTVDGFGGQHVGVPLSAGNYWLHLSDAYAVGYDGHVSWVTSGGPSTAYYYNTGYVTPSNAFRIYDGAPATATTPEPTTMVMWGIGLAGIGIARLRKRWKATASA
jgi:hypothetical protein